MDKRSDKKTGLGNSLLLRRTEPTLEPEIATEAQSSDRSEPQKLQRSETPDGEVLQTPQPPEDPLPPTPKPQPVRDRCTIYLDPDVNRRLHVVARIEGKDRSDIVTEILRQYLPEFEVVYNKE